MTPDPAHNSKPPNPLPALLCICIAIWLPTINHLRFEWSINAQYGFGWFVPFLTLYLFSERWKSRPKPAAARTSVSLIAVAAIAALAFLPIRVIQEANPDWRLVSWIMALSSLVFTSCAIFYTGGRPWLRHFAFPICFMLIAVPWPIPIEQNIVQKLMNAVTEVTVEALGWSAIPAVQQGNTISITNGVVGVEEACSGVRSLQTSLMVSLFLGELLRFGWLRRLILVVCAVIVAFLLNIGRSFTLVILCEKLGEGGVAKWHDLVGYIVLALTLGALMLVTYLFRKKNTSPAPTPTALQNPKIPSWRIAIGLICWLLTIEAATEVWYRAHEARSKPAAFWSIDWPEKQQGFREIKLPDVTRAMLLYNEARSVSWVEPDETEWSMVLIRWLPGRVSAQLARSHGPELCLSAAGATMVSDLGWRPMQIRDIHLPIRAYVFSANNKPLYVFYCIWEAVDSGDVPDKVRESLTHQRRINAVMNGRRNTGQQMLEIGVSNVSDAQEAEAAVRRMLEKVIH